MRTHWYFFTALFIFGSWKLSADPVTYDVTVNTSSISGKRGEGWLSVYSATKHGVVGFTEAMNKELGGDGIKSTALCPAFVDTPMTDFVKEHVPADTMIRPEDVAESVRYLLKLSPACVIPEFMFVRPGDAL